AHVAGTEHAAVPARIVRRRFAGREGNDHQRKQRANAHPPPHTPKPAQPGSPRGRQGIPPGFLAATPSQCVGTRDGSPGASASSAMRPPFSATQDFLVTGYLSV